MVLRFDAQIDEDVPKVAFAGKLNCCRLSLMGRLGLGCENSCREHSGVELVIRGVNAVSL